jgi:hypothetical protein
MRKIVALAGVVLAALTLSSCVKMDINLVVNKDATVSGYTIFAFEKSLAELGGSESDSPASDLINTDAEGVSVTEYNQDGFVGQKYTFTNVPFSEFSKSKNAKDELSFTRDGNKVTVVGALDFSSEDDGSDSDALGSAWAKSIMASAELDVAITFPGKIIESTGKISEDGHTVSWKPVLGEKLDLATTVELPSAASFIMPLASLALLASLGGAIYFFTAKRKSDDLSEETEEENPVL